MKIVKNLPIWSNAKTFKIGYINQVLEPIGDCVDHSLPIMFIELNPRSASAKETGIVLIAVSSSASPAVTRTPSTSMKPRKPF